MVENIVLQNTLTKARLSLSKVNTPDYILDVVDWGAIESTHHSFKYVNQIGVYVTSTSLETRTIDVSGWIIADTEAQMTNRKMMLNSFVNPKQAIDLFYEDYSITFLPNTSIRYSATIAENNEVICKFKIDGVCPDPLFAEKKENRIDAANTVGMFHFPLIISKEPDPPGGIVFGYRRPSLIVGVRNSGAVDVGMKILFKAKGTVENPSLINVHTQDFIKINKTLEAGEQIKVNTTTGSKKIIGIKNGIEHNYFKYRDLESEWLQLKVGDNLLRYDADNNINNLEVFIYFKNRFLEVQQCY